MTRDNVLDYYSDSVLQLEFEKLFKPFWHIGAHKCELANNRDYVILEIYDFQVVIYNDNGEIIAFNNICPHRGARLIDNDCKIFGFGNSQIRCKYHGWSYKKSKLNVIDVDNFDSEKICNRDLLKYKVGFCGDLIFFAFEPRESLKEQLGSFYDDIEHISKSISNRIDINTDSDFKSNWKISLENSLEGYHLPFVHSETFMPLKLNRDKLSECNKNTFAFNSFLDERIAKKYKRFKTTFLESNFYRDGYFCYHIFPFGWIASTCGFHYTISPFYPHTSTHTNYCSRTYSVKESSASAYTKDWYKGLVDISHKIVDEDTEVADLMQKGVSKFIGFKYFIYHNILEGRIGMFHKNYKEAMNEV